MDIELGMGLVDTPFDIPNIQVENGPVKHHVRIGWLRSVANVYHAFAMQSFVDEMAAAAGRDPIEYQLDLIGQGRKIGDLKTSTPYWNYTKSLDMYPLDTARLRISHEARDGANHVRLEQGCTHLVTLRRQERVGHPPTNQ